MELEASYPRPRRLGSAGLALYGRWCDDQDLTYSNMSSVCDDRKTGYLTDEQRAPVRDERGTPDLR
jgi:hypothetical protein